MTHLLFVDYGFLYSTIFFNKNIAFDFCLVHMLPAELYKKTIVHPTDLIMQIVDLRYPDPYSCGIQLYGWVKIIFEFVGMLDARLKFISASHIILISSSYFAGTKMFPYYAKLVLSFWLIIGTVMYVRWSNASVELCKKIITRHSLSTVEGDLSVGSYLPILD